MKCKALLAKKSCKQKPNPPLDGRILTVRNNCRYGYADYQPGMIYIDAFSVTQAINPIARNNNTEHVKIRFDTQRKRMPHQSSNSRCPSKLNWGGGNAIKVKNKR